MSKKALDTLAKKVDSIFASSATRTQYNRSVGQVFIFSYRKNEKLLNFAFTKAGVKNPERETEQVMKYIRTRLVALEKVKPSSFGMRRARDYKARILAGAVPGIKIKPDFQEVYVVPSYSSVNRVKNKVGKMVEELTRGRVASSAVTGAQQAGGIKATSGVQLGHGEFGAPVALVKTLKIEQVLSRFGGSEELLRGFQGIKESYGITTEIKHDMLLTSKGTLKKGWTVVISSQGARSNQLDAKQEAAFIREVRKFYEANVLDLKGSESLKEAVEMTLLDAIAPSKARIKSKQKRKKKVVSKGKGSAKSKRTEVGPRIIRGDIAESPAEVQRDSNSTSALALLGILNQQLPSVLASNMESPALQNQTGRFAASVRVTDVATTRRGFPSIGYTYDKYPYQTFEMGYAQGSPERDPRKLIDKSIREIAAGLAIGRFYTRRV